jgi:hypothetical protein
MAKTITNQQIIGSRGEAFVSERANAMGFMFSRYGPPEVGMDGLLEIRDPVTGAASGRLVAVQVKTRNTGSYSGETEASFEYLMDETDVAYWKGCNLPVIVVLVHLERHQAYWKSVDTGEGPSGRRLRIDKTNDLFDASTRDAIADLCVAKSGFGVWFPSLKTGETGHLNLLEVILPESIYVAASPFTNGRAALHELLIHEERPPDDWIIRGGQFMSFRDPRESALLHIVDPGSVESIGSEEIAFPDGEAEERNMIELRRRTLGAQLDGVLAYSRDQRAFHFPAVHDTIERSYHYRSLKNWTSADVVKKYEKDGTLKYVRHHAFEPRFWQIDEQWLLSATPTFVFTWDGFRPDKFASGRLAGKKQREHNSALLGQFAMWKFLLTGAGVTSDTSALFAWETGHERVLRFQPIETLDLLRGVPDDLWRTSEPEMPEDTDQGRLAV